MGGVARRATKIKTVRSEKKQVLVLDAGNSLISEQPNPQEPAARTRGQTSVEALNRLGYDAVALGDLDLLLGREELAKRIAEAKGFTFVSANVKDQATGKLLVDPYVIKEVGGHRVALLGITGRLPLTATAFSLVPPLDAAREYVPRLRSEADVVILLSNATIEEDRAIASQLPGIDLIIAAGAEALTEPLELPGGTLLVKADKSSTGHAGRVVGELRVEFDRDGHATGHEWAAVPLDPSLADDPDMAAWAKSITAE